MSVTISGGAARAIIIELCAITTQDWNIEHPYEDWNRRLDLTLVELDSAYPSEHLYHHANRYVPRARALVRVGAA